MWDQYFSFMKLFSVCQLSYSIYVSVFRPDLWRMWQNVCIQFKRNGTALLAWNRCRNSLILKVKTVSVLLISEDYVPASIYFLCSHHNPKFIRVLDLRTLLKTSRYHNFKALIKWMVPVSLEKVGGNCITTKETIHRKDNYLKKNKVEQKYKEWRHTINWKVILCGRRNEKFRTPQNLVQKREQNQKKKMLQWWRKFITIS